MTARRLLATGLGVRSALVPRCGVTAHGGATAYPLLRLTEPCIRQLAPPRLHDRRVRSILLSLSLAAPLATRRHDIAQQHRHLKCPLVRRPRLADDSVARSDTQFPLRQLLQQRLVILDLTLPPA